jgi:3-hydroxyisobutyrate dehydrogenase
MTSIAVLGTGQMGAAIARRLLAAGLPVTVWNRTSATAAPLAEANATIAATPAQAVAGADVVITMLTDARAVDAALFGVRDGPPAVAALKPGAVVVQMSTIAPDEVRRVAVRLPQTISFLDAPVGGSVGAVSEGDLLILAGGRDDTVDLVEPVLRHLGTVRRCGGIGTGAALKLVLNTALLTALAALRDTLVVADAVDVDRKVALEVLAAGPLRGAVARATAVGASFAIRLAAKDVRLALNEVKGAVPVAVATEQLLRAADQEADVSELIDLEDQ